MRYLREEGILVGSDERQEWLLPWWWEHFRQHNDYPVAFADFGLSEEKKQWCRERGDLIVLSQMDRFVKERDEVAPQLVSNWEERYPDTFWDSRSSWFKKPFACLQTPFQRTIWVDLDCEIKKSLQSLFNICKDCSGLALVKERPASSALTSVYNSGVIAFQKNHPVFSEWAKQSLEKNGFFRGDQDLLSQIISEKAIEVYELPSIYNWAVGYGEKKETVIDHWLGDAAKAALRSQIILDQLFREF